MTPQPVLQREPAARDEQVALASMILAAKVSLVPRLAVVPDHRRAPHRDAQVRLAGLGVGVVGRVETAQEGGAGGELGGH